MSLAAVASLAMAVTALGAACGDDAAVNPAAVDGGGGEGASPGATKDASLDAAGDSGANRAPFGLERRPANPTCRAPARPPSTTPVSLQAVYPGLDAYFITAMAQPPGDPTRWFAVTLDGRLLSFPSVSPPAEPTVVADLGALAGMPVNMRGEGGLFDLAIHPKFAQNGEIFVSWTTNGGPIDFRSVVSRLTSTDGGASFTHALVLGPFDQPTDGHNGGSVKFGPDGFLYLGFGDGGSTDDSLLNGQSKDGFFSKILRIDVDHPAPGLAYGIPDGNPFKTGGGEPATFARGFRNPFRMSFDRGTGKLWVADVGELSREEIDIVEAGGNYGWSCMEGTLPFMPARCSPTDALLPPIFEYPHVGTARASIIGGVVYRGAALPEITGSYFFSDYSSGDAFLLSFDATTGTPSATLLNPASPRASFVSFAEDVAGEVYAIDILGHLYQVVRTQPAPPSTFPARLSATGCVDPADATRPAPGVIPYDVNAPFWSDGADKQRFLALPDGKTITVGADGDFDLPIGSVLMKTFSLGGKRIETRLFVRHDDGDWAGYSYEWNGAQTDAVLLPSSKTKAVGSQTWAFPSRGECVGCHTQAAGRTLGLELGQLDRDLTYPSTGRVSNELATLDHIGLFSAPLGKSVASVVAYPTPTLPASGSLEARARAYLHANCSQCHRPLGPSRGGLDLRFATTLAATHTCGTIPTVGDLGVAGARVLAPGSPATSLISLRPHALDTARMPPLASSVVDTAGLGVVDDWIRSLPACP